MGGVFWAWWRKRCLCRLMVVGALGSDLKVNTPPSATSCISSVFTSDSGPADVQLAGRQKCSLRLRVTSIRKPQAKQRAKAKAKAQACVWALGAHLSRVVVLYLMADGWLDPALLCSRQRGRQHNLADKDGKELEGIVETTFERTPDTDILALAGMVCPFR